MSQEIPHILVVDDSPIVVDMMCVLLRASGYGDVIGASSGQEALTRLHEKTAQVVITDVHMPDGDGISLLKDIVAQWPETIVIVVTGYGTISEAVEAIKIGAYDYLTKPVDGEELTLLVKRASAYSKLRSENMQLRQKLSTRCFISYSTNDQALASRLYDDLQDAGLRCWKWDHDARTGRNLWAEIDNAIRTHDKVLLILSRASLKSPAVNREIERALQAEDERIRAREENGSRGDTDVLFPIRVDDYVFNGWSHERRADVLRKVIADATRWSNTREYNAMLQRLIAHLAKEDT